MTVELFDFGFTSRIHQIGRMDSLVGTDAIHSEPMLFDSSVDFARSAGGPLTRMFLSKIEEELLGAAAYCESTQQFLSIDTRSHMLMPGFRPAIGGWHCDAYPRPHREAQPILRHGKPDNFHIVAFVSDREDGVSRTQFIQSGHRIPLQIDPGKVWASVNGRVGDNHPTLTQVDGQILKFWQETLHRACCAHAPGWRWWARVSVVGKAPTNMIRKQVQVYGDEGQSW